MLKSQSYHHPSMTFRTSNSPPFPISHSIPVQSNTHQHHSNINLPPAANHTPFATLLSYSNQPTNTTSGNPLSQGFSGLSSSTSPPHISKSIHTLNNNGPVQSLPSTSTSSSPSPPSVTNTITSPSSLQQSISAPSTSTSSNTSLSNSASASSSSIMSHNVSASSFFPSGSFQSFIPSQYSQPILSNNVPSNTTASFTSSNSIKPPNIMSITNNSSISLPPHHSHAHPPSQPASASGSSAFFSTSIPPVIDDSKTSSNYPYLRVLNLPRDIQEREFEIMFTFAADFLGTELQKSPSLAEDGFPASVVGLAYFKTLSAATTALGTLARNIHVFTPKEFLARSNTLSSSPFAIKIELIPNRNSLSNDSLSSISRINSFNINPASSNGPVNIQNGVISIPPQQQQQPQPQPQSSQQSSTQQQQSAQPQQPAQYKNISRFVFSGSGSAGAPQPPPGSQQPMSNIGTRLDMPPNFNELYEGQVNNGGVFSPSSPRGMFPIQPEEYLPRMSGKSLLLESQSREDEEYNDIVKDVGWYSRAPAGNGYASSTGPSNATPNQVSSPIGYNSSSNGNKIPAVSNIVPSLSQTSQQQQVSQKHSPPAQKVLPQVPVQQQPQQTQAQTQPQSQSLPQPQPQSQSQVQTQTQQPQQQQSHNQNTASQSKSQKHTGSVSQQPSASQSQNQTQQSQPPQKQGSQSPPKGKSQSIQGKGSQAANGQGNGYGKHGSGRSSNSNSSTNQSSSGNTAGQWTGGENGNSSSNGTNNTSGNSSSSTSSGKKSRSSTSRTFQNLSLGSANANANTGSNSGNTNNSSSNSNGSNSNSTSSSSGNSPVDNSKIAIPYSPTNSGTTPIHIMQSGGRVLPSANPADQNPPCNTLYVGNLPPDTNEDELKTLFSSRRGYKRLCFRTKANGPMCFVEFEDVNYATRALEELYGYGLSNSVKGGIRLSFSKNPLGVRSQPNSNNGGGSGNSTSSGGSGASNAGNNVNNSNNSGSSSGNNGNGNANPNNNVSGGNNNNNATTNNNGSTSNGRGSSVTSSYNKQH